MTYFRQDLEESSDSTFSTSMLLRSHHFITANSLNSKVLAIIFSLFFLVVFGWTFFVDVRETINIQKRHSEYEYSIGDILNFPRLHEPIRKTGYHKDPHFAYDQYETACSVFVPSIVSHYCQLRTDISEVIPNITKLRQAAEGYCQKYRYNMPKELTLVQHPVALCIHLRSGDKGLVEPGYLSVIKNLSFNFSTIFILSGVHNTNTNHQANQKSKKVLIESKSSVKQTIINSNARVVFTENPPDVDLCIIRQCQNALLHRGGFSEIASFIFQGKKLFLTKFYPLDAIQGEHENNMLVKPIYL